MLAVKVAAAERDSETVAVHSSAEHENVFWRTELSNVDKKFRQTVRNIRKHLGHCNVQDLITYFNMSASDIPYFSEEVKKKLHKCATI